MASWTRWWLGAPDAMVAGERRLDMVVAGGAVWTQWWLVAIVRCTGVKARRPDAAVAGVAAGATRWLDGGQEGRPFGGTGDGGGRCALRRGGAGSRGGGPVSHPSCPVDLESDLPRPIGREGSWPACDREGRRPLLGEDGSWGSDGEPEVGGVRRDAGCGGWGLGWGSDGEGIN
jgi:hypothetical protein